MPTLTFSRNIGGLDLLSSSEIFDGIMGLDIVSRSSSKLTLDLDGAVVNFFGTGIGYQMAGGRIVGITGGTVTRVTITNDAGTITGSDWSGLKVSAISFFEKVATSNWAALNNLLFGTGDTYKLTDGADRARGFGGNDKIYGFGGSDVLSGDKGNDKLFGGNGADSLYGNSGADTLLGETGIDILRGGAGADVFAFTKSGATNRDIIIDFSAADDALHFDNNAFTAFAYTGQLKASGFVAGTAAGDSNDRFIYQKSTGNLWYDKDGSGSAAKVLVAELADGTSLTAADIFIL